MNDLFTRVKEEDQSAIAELYTSCREKGIKVAMSILHDEYLAEDMFHEAFVKAISNIDKFNPDMEFQPWFDVIVANTCKSYLRKKKPENFSDISDEDTSFADKIADTADTPEEYWDTQEVKQIVNRMLQELSKEQKDAIVLFHYGGLSVAEIAKYQNCSPDTVKSRLFQGRNKIKTSVEEYEKQSGIKLHSIAILPLLYVFFQSDMGEAYAAELDAAKLALSSGEGSIIGEETLSQIGKAAVKTGGNALAKKVLVGIAAVAVVSGTVAGVVAFGNGQKERQEEAAVAEVEAEAMQEENIEAVIDTEAVAENEDATIPETETVEEVYYLPTYENTELYDSYMEKAWNYYVERDFRGLRDLDVSQEMADMASEVMNSEADRYMYYVESANSYAMLLVEDSTNSYWWYFGDMKNGIRQGNGCAIIFWYNADGYDMYEGEYVGDFADGQGAFTNAVIDEINYYTMTGEMQGRLFDGTYNVKFIIEDIMGEEIASNIEFDNGWPVVTYEQPYIEISEDERVVIFNLDDAGNYVYWTMNEYIFENGMDVFKGKEPILREE